MPWKETCPLEQRVQFLSEWKKGEASMAALCRAFGISRPPPYTRPFVECKAPNAAWCVDF